MLGIDLTEFVQADLAGKHSADQKLGAIAHVEEPPCFGQVAVHRTRSDVERSGNLLVGQTATGEDDAVPRPGIEAWPRSGRRTTAPAYPPCVLEAEDTDKLDRAKMACGSAVVRQAGKGT